MNKTRLKGVICAVFGVLAVWYIPLDSPNGLSYLGDRLMSYLAGFWSQE